MRCPRCGFEQSDADACARCGVVFRKQRMVPPANVSHLAALKRAGLVLMVVGAADIAYMIYTVAHGRSYSSSLNVFALGAGILLYRGSLGTARVVAQAAAFMVAAMLGATLLMPAVVPWDLLAIGARLHPGSWVLGAIEIVALVALLLWLRSQLTQGAVADAFRSSGKEPPGAPVPFVIGGALAVVLCLALRGFLYGESAKEAIALARPRVGSDYRFFVTAMSVSESGGRKTGVATVIAYRRDDMRSLVVPLGSASEEGSTAAAPAPESSVAPDAPTEGQGAAHLRDGNELLRAGKLQPAIDEYGVAISLDGNDSEAYSRRAEAYAKEGEYGKALADVDTVMVLDPDRIGSYEMADWILVHQGDWDGITARWTRFITSHPTSGKAYLERGGAYHHKGDEAAARRDIDQACTLHQAQACELLTRLPPPTAP